MDRRRASYELGVPREVEENDNRDVIPPGLSGRIITGIRLAFGQG